MNDVIMNKKESIECCIKQIRTYYGLPSEVPFAENYLRQDAVALNLQRACEQCIDLANYVIKVSKAWPSKRKQREFSVAGGKPHHTRGLGEAA